MNALEKGRVLLPRVVASFLGSRVRQRAEPASYPPANRDLWVQLDLCPVPATSTWCDFTAKREKDECAHTALRAPGAAISRTPHVRCGGDDVVRCIVSRVWRCDDVCGPRGISRSICICVYVYAVQCNVVHMRCAVYGNVRRKPRNVHASCNCKRRPRGPRRGRRRARGDRTDIPVR